MVSTEISRQRLSGANRPTRAPEERLAIRLRLRNRTWRRFEALAPRSPVRRRLIARAVERGVSAYNRRDWPAFGLAFHPRASFHPPAALVESGTADLIDAGERIVLLGEIVGEGAHSGVPIGGRRAWVWQHEKGRIESQWEYDGHAEALAAVGVTG